MEFEISLNNLKFNAYHGVLEEERKIGNEFVVNLAVKIPVDPQISQDELQNTVSYSDLFDIVKEEMEKTRNLLETVTIEIAKRIKSEFPNVVNGRISIEKTHPPIPGIIGSAEVRLNF